MNPNKNKHFNDEALRINRKLKKENDELKRLLYNLIDSADCDTPQEYRTKHFKLALDEAQEFLI